MLFYSMKLMFVFARSHGFISDFGQTKEHIRSAANDDAVGEMS